MTRRSAASLVIVLLLSASIWFRLQSLGSMPGVNGDEGWWGVQATSWLAGRPYEAHTTSGNPTDLFLLVPLALLHTFANPSFALLRIIPALVNLIALPVGFWSIRRVFGTTTAWVFTVALAIMPTAIAHSRICQDPSQSVFWSGLVVYFSLLGLSEATRAWRWLAAALAVLPVMLWTHPTNVFVTPFLALPLVPLVAPRLPASRRTRVLLAAGTVLVLVGGLIAALGAMRWVAGSNEYVEKPWLAMAVARLADGKQWFAFAANNARFFNGVTVYHYFSGARPTTIPYDAGFVIAVSVLGWGLLTNPRRGVLDNGLILACTGTWLAFYAFAGPVGLQPHFERWGLCLIVPGLLVLSRGVAAWTDRLPEPRRWIPLAASAAIGFGLTGSFYWNYVRAFTETGGRSHLTYVTADREPKQQALEHILARASGGGGILIATQQWWLRWPIAYLATAHPDVAVVPGLDVDRQPGFAQALRDGRIFFVEFTGTRELEAVAGWIRDRGLRAEQWTERDASGRSLLEIVRLVPDR